MCRKIIWTARINMYMCRTNSTITRMRYVPNYVNNRNKYVYMSNKFYKLSEQRIVRTEQIYMNYRSKYVYVWNKLYKRMDQIIHPMEQIFTIMKQILQWNEYSPSRNEYSIKRNKYSLRWNNLQWFFSLMQNK
jgi:hypothetical protein